MGTPESIALLLTNLLQPLQTELQRGKARLLLAELGIGITAEQEAGLLPSLQGSANATTTLVNQSTELLALIKAGNTADVIKKGGEMIAVIKTVFDSIQSIRQAISNLHDAGIQAAAISKLPERLFNHLLISYLDGVQYLNPLLYFLGILELNPENGGSVDPKNPPFTSASFHPEKIGAWLGNPAAQLKSLYKWDDPAFDGKQLFLKLQDTLQRINLPALYNEASSPAKLDLLFLELAPTNGSLPKGLEITLKSNLPKVDATIQGEDIAIHYKAGLAAPVSSKLLIRPGEGISLVPPNGSAIGGELLLEEIIKKKNGGGPYLLLGKAGGSRVEVTEFRSKLGTKLGWDAAQNKAAGNFLIEAALKQCKVVISTDGADGFLKAILPATNLEAQFDLTVGVSAEHGLYFGGSSALEINLPTHVQLGPVSLEGISIGLQPQDGKFPVNIGANLRASLGPMVAVVQNMGMSATLSFPPSNGGNLGPVQLDIGFKAPGGIGLSIDAGMVKGGGFLLLDPIKGEYAGGLELTISNTLQVAAIGIINTRMPDGKAGFSLLVIVSVQFNPGIALGMGFFLNGLGGMLGIHRTVNINALREGVKNDAIEHIMFPENIVANMNTLLPQLKSIFPVKKDQFMIGLMAKITWGVPALVSVEFGLAIEFSHPTRLAILGVLKVVLPNEKAPLLQLQVNFAGVIDFEEGSLSFDASLYNSRILSFTLEGDMALRLNWGATKGFLLSVGGFHPSFTPPSQLNVPALKRLTLTILSGNPKLVLTAYLAVTSNTVQFGARIDFLFKVAFVKVVGFLGFDVLFQFSPFKFIAHIFAGLAVKWGDTVLFAIKLDFQLAGPTPWNARGVASFTVLLIPVSVNFNITWGQAKAVTDPAVALLPKIKEALNQDANWSTGLPKQQSSLITLAPHKAKPGELIIQSHGTIQINQSILPLDTQIQQFGNRAPADIKRLRIHAATLGGIPVKIKDLRDQFVPASYKKLSDDDKLKAPSYTQEKSGVTLADRDNALHVLYGINRDVQYEVKVSDHAAAAAAPSSYPISLYHFQRMSQGGVISKSALSKAKSDNLFSKEGSVKIGEEQFVIVNNATLAQYKPDVFQGGSQAEADDMFKTMIAAEPALKKQLSVVPAYHLDL
ncbi:MAG: hypothetical protein INR73_21635 [Williamsia sp.]|nr:hypothetical protein [Williamsia sp.]